MCVYEKEEVLARSGTAIWTLYVILAEIMVRIGPCILLITLNLLMIRDFHASIVRRRALNNMIIRRLSSPDIPRRRKITASSYTTSHDSGHRINDKCTTNAPANRMTTISMFEKVVSRPIVINVSLYGWQLGLCTPILWFKIDIKLDAYLKCVIHWLYLHTQFSVLVLWGYHRKTNVFTAREAKQEKCFYCRFGCV